jgi:cation transport ATPase
MTFGSVSAGRGARILAGMAESDVGGRRPPQRDAGARLGWFVAHGPGGLLLAVLAGLVTGGFLHLAGQPAASREVWAATTGAGIAASLWWVIDASRHHRLGADAIALLALAGTLIVGEHLAGAVIAVMLASGRTLEAWAAARSERELRLLLDRAPRIAHRRQGDSRRDELVDTSIEDVAVSDLLMVKPGEVIPVDGRVEAGLAVIDEAALTGESVPVERQAGDAVRSGAVNVGGPFDLRGCS